MTNRQRVWLLPGSAAGLIVGILAGRAMDSVWFGAAAAALALLAVVVGHGRPRFAALICLALGIGSIAGWLAWHPALPEMRTVELTGVISDEIRIGQGGHVRTVLRDVTLDGQPFSAGVYWSCYTDALPDGLVPGARISMRPSLYAPGSADNPGGYDFRENMLQNGVTLGAYGKTDLRVEAPVFSFWGLTARLRDAIARGLMRVMGDEAGGYAATMLVGSRSLIAQEDREAFSRMGIAHILSVSGFHVGVLSMLLGWVLGRTRLRKPARLLIRLGLLTAYALLTGLRAPVVRAAVLSLLPEYGRLYHRKSSSLHMLSASAILLLLMNPTQLTSAGFHLTYAAVIGIYVIVPWLRERFTQPRRLPAPLYDGMLASLAAQIGLLLPQLYWFQELPLFGLLFNIPVMLLSPVLLGLYWLMLPMMVIPFVGEGLGWLTGRLTEALITGVRAAGSADWLTLWTAQANLLTAAGCVLLLASLSRIRAAENHRGRKILACLLLIGVSVIPLPDAAPSYIQLSVGNADAAVLRDGRTVCVIDTGEDQTLSTYLHQRRLGIDMLFLTHLHTDHAGGVRALIDDHIPVKQCFIPYGAAQALVTDEMLALLHELEARGTVVTELGRGDVLELPDGQVTVLWPETGRVRPGLEANDSSMVLLARIRGTSLLLTGDMDGPCEAYTAHPADILKAPHHGSAAGTTADFLAVTDPTVILVSCGDARRETSIRSRADSRSVYATHSGGALTVRFLDGRYLVMTYK